MEGTSENAARVVAEYGGDVAVPDADVLEPLIRKALVQSPRTIRLAQPPSDAITRVVTAVQYFASESEIEIDLMRLLLLVRTPQRFTVDGPGVVVCDNDLAQLADVIATASTVKADVRRPQRFQRHVCDTFLRTNSACVLLDLSNVETEDVAHEFLHHIRDWLDAQPLRMVSLTDYRASSALPLLEATP
jgi:hypothetical protein